MKKVLIIRFSSIGDIVLTSPIVRSLKNQLENIEIHYLTKKSYGSIVQNNPNINRVYVLGESLNDVIRELQKENYDFVVDLHRNLRSFRVKKALKKPSGTFSKLNFEKFLLTKFKVNKLPEIHIVDRYFGAVKKLGVKNDQAGLSYYIPNEDQVLLADYGIHDCFAAFAIGAQFATKRLPKDKIISLIKQISSQIVLLGGPSDVSTAASISESCPNVINLCGKLNLNQSASIVQQSQVVITHDTGLMHIASSFEKKIISIWGNTVPEFGMYPYQPSKPANYSIFEVKDLPCRPCSKIGHNKCPKEHFKCMINQPLVEIAEAINSEF